MKVMVKTVKTFCEEVRAKLDEHVPEGIVTFRGLMLMKK